MPIDSHSFLQNLNFTPEAHQRALKRLFWVMFILCIPYTIMFYFVGAKKSLLGPLFLTATICIAYWHFIQNKLNSAGFLIANAMLIAPIWCIWFSGGISSPLMIWTLHGPVLAGILVNWRYAGILCICSVIYYCVLISSNYDFQSINELEASGLIYEIFCILVTVSSVFFICLYIFIVMEEVKNSTLFLHEKNKEIEHMANHDYLTGLPNRLFLNKKLKDIASFINPDQKKISVLFIDIDNFKLVNDLLGHSSGDKFLLDISEKLKESVNKNDTIIRLGGDEFAVILSNINSHQTAIRIAKKIIDSLYTEISIKHDTFYISASIGISMIPDDAKDLETAISNADIAMYEAKSIGKNNFCFFKDAINKNRYIKTSNQATQNIE